jgi:hypothetical protein
MCGGSVIPGDRVMSFRLITPLGAAALALSALASHAGPCTQDIDLLADRLRVVEEVPSLPESRAARLHHQPTAQSVARAQADLRGRYDTKAATAALARARDADQAADAARCARVLDEARRALAIKPESPAVSR